MKKTIVYVACCLLLIVAVCCEAVAFSGYAPEEADAEPIVEQMDNLSDKEAPEEVVEPESEPVEEVVEVEEPAPEPETTYVEPAPVYNETYYAQSYSAPSGVLNAYNGVNSYNGYTEKYYSSNVAPHKDIAQWTLRDDGVWVDSDGYVVVASQHHEYGSNVDTSLGMGKVYDYCETPGVVDIYTAW